jgi:hypothetical protein
MLAILMGLFIAFMSRDVLFMSSLYGRKFLFYEKYFLPFFSLKFCTLPYFKVILAFVFYFYYAFC